MGGGFETNQGASNQVTNSAPWKGQKPYLLDLYSTASKLSKQPLQMYPGEMIAPEDQAAVDARAAAEARARAGSPLLTGAQDYTQNVLGGNYLNSNPWSDAQYDKIAGGITRNYQQAVLPAIATRYGTSGMLGSSMEGAAQSQAARGLGESLGGAAVDFYGNQYNAERGYQENARTAAPGLAEADYGDINVLGQVGQQRTDLSQQRLDELIQRFDFAQNEPWQRAGQFASLLGSPITGKTNTYGNQTDQPSGGSIARAAFGGKGN